MVRIELVKILALDSMSFSPPTHPPSKGGGTTISAFQKTLGVLALCETFFLHLGHAFFPDRVTSGTIRGSNGIQDGLRPGESSVLLLSLGVAALRLVLPSLLLRDGSRVLRHQSSPWRKEHYEGK